MSEHLVQPEDLDRLRHPCDGQLDFDGRPAGENRDPWPDPTASHISNTQLASRRPSFAAAGDTDDRWDDDEIGDQQ